MLYHIIFMKKGVITLKKNREDYDYLAHSASCQDCTGLIPFLPESDEELESYEDIYPYQPPKVIPAEKNKYQ